jgi:predicted membrane protein
MQGCQGKGKMRRSELIIGSIVLGLGIVLLLGEFFNIDVFGLLCPAGMIGLGVWFIYRTQKKPLESDLNIKFVGKVQFDPESPSQQSETWGFVLDSRLDFREINLQEGETTLRIGAFVNDIKAKIPVDIGFAVYSAGFMTESNIAGDKQQTFFMPFSWQSNNYESSEKKINFKPTCFVSEINIEIIDP